MSSPAHTVIYTQGRGRLGNQLIRFAHWMAWVRAQAGRAEVIDVGFWPFAGHFAAWRESPGCVFPARRSAADTWARLRALFPVWALRRGETPRQRLVHALGRCRRGWQAIRLDDARGEAIDLDSPAFFERISRCPVTTCTGWKVAGWRLFAEHQAELRRYFQPESESLARAREFLAPLRQQYDVIAGLLIRQTDYREWHDGRFCYPTADYAAWIRQLLDLHSGRRVGIVVACDERQDPKAFAGLPCHFATGSANAGGHWFESFVELSLCDLVLSPPSTFAAAAAYVRVVPLWPLVEKGQQLAFAQLLTDPLVEAARHPVFSLAVK